MCVNEWAISICLIQLAVWVVWLCSAWILWGVKVGVHYIASLIFVHKVTANLYQLVYKLLPTWLYASLVPQRDNPALHTWILLCQDPMGYPTCILFIHHVNIEMLTLSCGPIAIINVMVFSQFPIIFLQGCPCTVTVINIMAFHGPHQIPAVLPLHYYCFTAVKVICQHPDVDTFLWSYYWTPTLAPCISSPAVGCFSVLQLLTSPYRHSVPQHYD